MSGERLPNTDRLHATSHAGAGDGRWQRRAASLPPRAHDEVRKSALLTLRSSTSTANGEEDAAPSGRSGLAFDRRRLRLSGARGTSGGRPRLSASGAGAGSSASGSEFAGPPRTFLDRTPKSMSAIIWVIPADVLLPVYIPVLQQNGKEKASLTRNPLVTEGSVFFKAKDGRQCDSRIAGSEFGATRSDLIHGRWQVGQGRAEGARRSSEESARPTPPLRARCRASPRARRAAPATRAWRTT